MPDQQNSTTGFGLWVFNARDGFMLIGAILGRFPQNLSTLRQSDRLILAGFAGLAAVVTLGAAVVAGPVYAAIQLLGFGAHGLSLLNQRLEYNHHKLAVQPIVSGGIALQQTLLGGFGYAVMAGVAAARSWTFSMIPETPRLGPVRTAIAVGYAGTGITMIAGLSALTGRYENLLTIPSMLMGTVADRCPSDENDPSKDFTRHARLLRFFANANNALFNMFVSHSWAGLTTDILATANLKNAIQDYDMPHQKSDGSSLTHSEALLEYGRSILTLKPVCGLSLNALKTQMVDEFKGSEPEVFNPVKASTPLSIKPGVELKPSFASPSKAASAQASPDLPSSNPADNPSPGIPQ